MKANRISFAERTTADFSDHTAANDYFDQRHVVSNLLYRPIEPSCTDAPTTAVDHPFLHKRPLTQRFERPLQGSCRSVVSELPSASQSLLDPSDCLDSNNIGSLRNDLRNRKVPPPRSADDGQLALRRYEGLVATLSDELSALRGQLAVLKQRDEDQLSQLEALARATAEADGLRRQVKLSESFHEDLKGRLRKATDSNADLHRSMGQLKDQVHGLLLRLEVFDWRVSEDLDFGKAFESINARLSCSKGEFHKAAAFKAENDGLRAELHKRSAELQSLAREVEALRSRPVQVHERIVTVESAESRREVAELTARVQALQRDNGLLRSCPVVQEKVVFQALPCGQCPAKERQLLQLKAQLDRAVSAQTELAQRGLPTESVVSISCQCSQSCRNCGANPQTNIRLFDSSASKVVSNVPLRIARSDSVPVSPEQVVFGQSAVVGSASKLVNGGGWSGCSSSVERQFTLGDIGTQWVRKGPVEAFSPKDGFPVPGCQTLRSPLTEQCPASVNCTESRPWTPTVYKLSAVAVPPSLPRSVSQEHSADARRFQTFSPSVTPRESLFQQSQSAREEGKENARILANPSGTGCSGRPQHEHHRSSISGVSGKRETFGVSRDGRLFKTSTPAVVGGQLQFNEYSY